MPLLNFRINHMEQFLMQYRLLFLRNCNCVLLQPFFILFLSFRLFVCLSDGLIICLSVCDFGCVYVCISFPICQLLRSYGQIVLFLFLTNSNCSAFLLGNKWNYALHRSHCYSLKNVKNANFDVLKIKIKTFRCIIQIHYCHLIIFFC